MSPARTPRFSRFRARAIRAALLTGCALAAAGLPAAQEPRAAAVRGERVLSVLRHDAQGEALYSVRSRGTSLAEFLRELAGKADLVFDAADASVAGAVVSLEFERRPLEEVLTIALGTQGLRHELQDGRLRIEPEPDDAEGLLRLALEAWETIEARGDGAAAPYARLTRGQLAEHRGDLSGAYVLYSELAHGEMAEEVPEATYRAGRVLQRLGHWAEAAQHFRTLGGMDGAQALYSKTRLELARCYIELGDAESALHLLNFLAANYPSDDAVELAERRLVRARALNAIGRHVAALRALEEGDVEPAPRSWERALAVRAEALERLGYASEAARAWLLFGRECTRREQRTRAFQRAAELALDGGDELGALFACREAAKHGAGDDMAPIARRARLRLGLKADDAPITVRDRLERAERLVLRGETDRAAELFEVLYLAGGTLGERERARVVRGWSRVLHARSGLDEAVRLLRRTRASFVDPEALRIVDVAAATLFESEGRFDEAARAYQGDYGYRGPSGAVSR